MVSSRTPERFQTQKIIVLSVCHFIHDIYSSFFAPLLPLLIEKLSLTLTQAGFLSTVMQLPALMNPLLGSLADRTSVRYFIILAPATTAIPMCLLGLAPSYGVLLILLFITGISIAVFHVPAPVMVSRLAGDRKGKGMSFFMTGGEMARAVGPLVTVGGVSLLGLEGFYPIMIVGIAASVWLFFKFRDVSITVKKKQSIGLFSTFRQMRHILLPLAAILIARGFMHASLTTFLPTFVASETGNLWLAGMALTLFELCGVAGVMTSGSLSDHFGRRKILRVSLIGAPISLFLFAFIGGWMRFGALIVAGFTLLSTTPVMLAMVQEHATSSPSAANGMFMLISFIARSAVVVIVGFIGDQIGLRATYFISAALGLTALPFIFMLPGAAKTSTSAPTAT
ncbi:MAG: MFS transporter [Deltaproteobacteria bacterium]|nr:MAG: MFS transporter [Deltaproteobacteria bacterium]